MPPWSLAGGAGGRSTAAPSPRARWMPEAFCTTCCSSGLSTAKTLRFRMESAKGKRWENRGP
eukprot:10201226-Alexandrium_andersonii.AAC.1